MTLSKVFEQKHASSPYWVRPREAETSNDFLVAGTVARLFVREHLILGDPTPTGGGVPWLDSSGKPCAADEVDQPFMPWTRELATKFFEDQRRWGTAVQIVDLIRIKCFNAPSNERLYTPLPVLARMEEDLAGTLSELHDAAAYKEAAKIRGRYTEGELRRQLAYGAANGSAGVTTMLSGFNRPANKEDAVKQVSKYRRTYGREAKRLQMEIHKEDEAALSEAGDSLLPSADVRAKFLQRAWDRPSLVGIASDLMAVASGAPGDAEPNLNQWVLSQMAQRGAGEVVVGVGEPLETELSEAQALGSKVDRLHSASAVRTAASAAADYSSEGPTGHSSRIEGVESGANAAVRLAASGLVGLAQAASPGPGEEAAAVLLAGLGLSTHLGSALPEWGMEVGGGAPANHDGAGGVGGNAGAGVAAAAEGGGTAAGGGEEG